MDDVLIGWILIFFTLSWGLLCEKRSVQRLIHSSLGGQAWMLQWYTLALVGLGLWVLKSVFDIVYFDYHKLHFLDKATVAESIENICNGTTPQMNNTACTGLKGELEIPSWLHAFSLVSPVVAVISFVWMSAFFFRFVRLAGTRNESNPDPNRRMYAWRLPRRMRWVVNILGVQLIFNVMAVRCLIRMLAVMTGSSWLALPAALDLVTDDGQLVAGHITSDDWKQMVQLEISTSSMDLEIALTVQFWACFCFARLCTDFLQHTKMSVAANPTSSSNHDEIERQFKKYKRILGYAALQGVYVFCLVGLCRSLFDFVIFYLMERNDTKEMVVKLHDGVLAKIGIIFGFVTLLCMANMFFVSKSDDMKDALGNANAKFMGTRFLLVLAQIQPQVLSLCTTDSPLFKTVNKFHEDGTFDKLRNQTGIDIDIVWFLHKWTFNEKQAQLFHASLLNFESIIIATLTFCFWQLTEPQIHQLMQEEDHDWYADDTQAEAREWIATEPEEYTYRALPA